MYWIGVDIGGTFTDLSLINSDTFEVRTHKTPTTPADPALGFLTGVDEMLRDNGIPMTAVSHIVHGTTLASNVILEGKGRGIALLTTQGFRDVLIIQRQKRFDIYDLDIEKPKPLLRRRDIHEMPERMNSRGEVVKAATRANARKILDRLADQGVRSLAVSFLHSYANPEHEQLIRDVATATHPEMSVSLSSDVAPQLGEYERTMTTVANAYVMPEVRDYLERLLRELGKRSFTGGFYLMQSNGGIITVEQATCFPVRIVESGPAAGALIAGVIAKAAGEQNIIAFDMGGTTAKMCLLEDYKPKLTNELEVGKTKMAAGSGLPLLIPSVDLVEIGTGGGSMVKVALGTLSVGPESASSVPGPICYGRGGKVPTVTDANLILGYLNPDYFLGGRMKLDFKGAIEGMREQVARPLGLSVEEAAWGVHKIATANMAAATRLVSIEHGKDPRNFALVSTGGSAGLHAAHMARELGVRKVIFPRVAGVASAVGLLAADGRFDLSRPLCTSLDASAMSSIRDALKQLVRSGVEQIEAVRPGAPTNVQSAIELRYKGQGYAIAVPVRDCEGTVEIHQLTGDFHRLYAQLYGYADEDVDLEVVSCKVTVRAPGAELNVRAPKSTAATGHPSSRRRIWFPQARGYTDCAVYHHESLTAGAEITGPALVESSDTTIVVFPGDRVVKDEHANLILECADSLGSSKQSQDATAHAVHSELALNTTAA